jgi:uncharacterized repeat protein (TIGR03843 family)
MDNAAILKALSKGEITIDGQFMQGSNYTFRGLLTYEDQECQVVYKPVRGEQPLWDFPRGSLAHREVAAYLLSEMLGWQLVPPTVYRRKAPIGPGSVQLYIEHDPNYHYYAFEEEDRQRLRPAVLFDLIVNNADRKAGHILRGQEDGHLWLIDQGLCFHVDDKLRTVLWDFGGETIPPELIADLERLAGLLEAGEAQREELEAHIRPGEISAMLARSRELIEECTFPLPPTSRRSYPWPPV